MDIKCYDFVFYNDGQYYTNKVKKQAGTRHYVGEPELADLQIRIVGTEKQIDKALTSYIKKHGLALDESFSFKVEPEFWEDGRMNFHYFGEEYNRKVEAKLENYKQRYKENNCKTLFI
jgi:hypothetical protein